MRNDLKPGDVLYHAGWDELRVFKRIESLTMSGYMYVVIWDGNPFTEPRRWAERMAHVDVLDQCVKVGEL